VVAAWELSMVIFELWILVLRGVEQISFPSNRNGSLYS
jgi:hypothetical protein